MVAENVAVLGASCNAERYSNKAVNLLIEKGYNVFPVNPREEKVCNLHCYKCLDEITEKIDTVTLYVNPMVLNEHIESIIKQSPKRVIMNPGTESDSAKERFENAGIIVQTACTLILLKTGQF